ncbi:hypothetical protein SPRG_11348 [Saprolegnia parasitica CBS 223.65]|uniref:Coiled-coil domain-containing protein 40 n=1 Tax=Saprolegnia parasitica (strain CBS 223.65) TaxID=695850 RepID=A0A067C772_SAPPC|nr:hypothetical protein SPRG_11348 [Saprolegnia parasitica CBS 223.65]KDO22396.1 hypothetical protein SPRG_11348 [Saprolegnia parasitica CBS 223.65]|eukprot:XP_012206919.1 hypothetical protein SPRG_11348 [Saprolegnia parasitica CBS 223.65]
MAATTEPWAATETGIDDDLGRDSDNDNDDDDDDEDDDDDPANDEQTIVDIGKHQRMQRIQKVLYDQLVGNDERITLELREKEEELRRAKTKREDLGVELYGVQQQLAQLQIALEGSHNKLNEQHDARFRAEDGLDDVKDAFAKKKLVVEKSQSQMKKAQTELDALNATLRQVEAYNQEMKSEIARNQRAAHKAEETVSTLEKEKKKQDLFIDKLAEEVKFLKEQTTLFASQLKVQKQETIAAEETLKEAAKQMEATAFEKKQLMQQWKSSLIGMSQRDQALMATQAAISNVVEQDLALASEIRGYKSSIEKAQTVHETLTGTMDRFDSENKFVEEQLGTLQQDMAKLSERHEMLTKSNKQTQSQVEKVVADGKKLDSETTSAAQTLETVQKERHALEDAIQAQKNTQTTMNKAANNLVKEAQKIQTLIHEKEILYANIKNEMARVNVDILNVQAHSAQLKEEQEKNVTELKAKDLAVEKTELEIRQRNDEIEKKMLRLDRLNKKYEQLVSNMEDENTGPLEATIKNIKKETAQRKKENVELQRDWLQIQTSLVNLTAESEDIREKNQELKSKTSILEQKQLRLVGEGSLLQSDVKELRAGITSMHIDTVKLNELIAKNKDKQELLQNVNFSLEIEFKRELKELEAESIAMEAQAQTIKAEKQMLLDQIIEVERQIMLWEKKIQIEKETQAALDPEVGQAEARNMEKEIHRMRLRLEALERDQERMVLDMERAIHKRDAIAMRGRGKKDSDVTQASLLTKVATLQNKCRKAAKETNALERAIKQRSIQTEDVTFQMDKISRELKQQEERAANLQRTINQALYDKQRFIDNETRKQRLLKRWEHIAQGKGIDPSNEAKCFAEREKATEDTRKIRELIQALQDQNPHLKEVLTRVAMLAEPV